MIISGVPLRPAYSPLISRLSSVYLPRRDTFERGLPKCAVRFAGISGQGVP